jgi:hypothetical protein
MSNSPFQHSDPSTQNGSPGVPQNIAGKIQAPAIALIISGVASGVIAVLKMIYSILHIVGANPFTAGQAERLSELRKEAGAEMAEMFDAIEKVVSLSNGPIAIVMGLVAIGLAVMTVVAGQRMKGFRSYGLAMAASILSCIPCANSCCCLGLPIGIWAIVVLIDPQVKAAFRR